MKTFKLVGVHLLSTDGDIIPVPIEDGLIINQENEQNTWLMEIFLEKKNAMWFQSYEEEHEFHIQATITKKENDPAYFSMRIVSYTEIDDYVTILFKGTLMASRNYYAELLLESLMNENLQGQELLKAFKERMKTKPIIRARALQKEKSANH